MIHFLSKLVVLMLVTLSSVFADLPAPISDADYHPVNKGQAELGQLLFYDRVLSGNRNIACSTCHHPSTGTSDGWSLGIGEGGVGLGNDREFGMGGSKANRRVPRNAPALWNLGAKEFVTLFHDGRAGESDLYDSGFDSPAEEFLPEGLTDIVAVQAMFPLTAGVEMAGNKNENEVPTAVTRRVDYAWQILTDRVKQHSKYVDGFVNAFDDVNTAEDITMVHIANAISSFERFEFRADQSPFDQYLRGEKDSLNEQEIAGMKLFYGDAGCSTCHAGVLQTDHSFHNIAMPFIGPGRTRRFDFKARDMGRINETDHSVDAYKFRTPSLRNIEHSGPYGHNGAYTELADIIMHHTDPVYYFEQYDLAHSELPNAEHLGSDKLLWADKQEKLRMLSTVTNIKAAVNEQELDSLIAFLGSLTDEQSIIGRLGIPESVPSGLEVDNPDQ